MTELEWQITMCCIGSAQEQADSRAGLLKAIGVNDLNRQLVDSLIEAKRKELASLCMYRRCRKFNNVTSITDGRKTN